MSEDFSLDRFDEYREDNRLEVKAAGGGLPQSLWESYSAMANTYGGVIICGVKENTDGSWRTTGLRDVNHLKKDFWNQVNNPNKVSVNLLHDSDVTDYMKDGDAILVIRVPMADRETRPVYINGDLFHGSFKRNHEGDYHCTRAEVRSMLRDEPRRTMDTKMLPRLTVDRLDGESVKTYRSWFATRHPGHPWNDLDTPEFLEMIGAANEGDDGTLHPTCAGLLMFGPEYLITREYPDYFLDYRDHAVPDVRWTDRVQSQSAEWSGNVFDFFGIVSRKLTRMLNVPFRLADMVRVDETPAHAAVREALVNCLVNADYTLPRSVVVESYPDRIVMANPGTIIVGKRQMLKGGVSEPRNAVMMKMFNLVGFGEHAGSGVPDIFAAWRQCGYAEPSAEEFFGPDQPSRTVLELPLAARDQPQAGSEQGDNLALSEKGPEKGPEEAGGESKAAEMERRESRVLDLLLRDGGISRAEIARRLNLSDKQVRRSIDNLRERGLVRREGSDRKGRWIVTRDTNDDNDENGNDGKGE